MAETQVTQPGRVCAGRIRAGYWHFRHGRGKDSRVAAHTELAPSSASKAAGSQATLSHLGGTAGEARRRHHAAMRTKQQPVDCAVHIA